MSHGEQINLPEGLLLKPLFGIAFRNLGRRSEVLDGRKPFHLVL